MNKYNFVIFIVLSFFSSQIMFAGDEASVGDVVIIEIMQNPAAVSDANGEWFEIYNNTGSTIDINGWTIKDNGSDSHVISNGGSLNISAGNVLVLGRNNSTGTNGNYTCNYQYSSFTLGNSDDEVILLDNSGDGIDSVYYDGGTDFPDPTGASMTLNVNNTTNLYKLNNVGSNWTTESASTYGDGDYGSPGSVGGDQSLPVELSYFTAIPKNGNVLLKWVTESEIENLGFILERNASFPDVFGWTEIASYITHPELQGQGSVTHRTEYEFIDKDVVMGKNYEYRLSDVDYNGVKTSHPVRSVLLMPSRIALQKPWPNPFNPNTQFSIFIHEESPVSIKIIDSLGREIKTILNQKSLSPGQYDFLWNGHTDSNVQAGSGMYYIRFESDEEVLSEKLLLIR